MRDLSLPAFLERAHAYDADLLDADVVDPSCTRAAWILSAHEAFTPDAPVHVLHGDAGWCPLMALDTGLGRTWMPLEASWGLASALVGPDADALASEFVAAVEARHGAWDALFLSGLARRGALFGELVRRWGRRRRLGLGQATSRCLASLEGGVDGFLSRRSSRFRKNLRRDRRRTAGEVVVASARHVTVLEVGALMQRVVAVERRSWKGAEGHGIDEGPMRVFYEAMAPRLAAAGDLRVTFATRDGEDVGYVLGAVFGDTYRGLQISFDESLRPQGLGNVMQLATIEALAAEGVRWYDLGTEMPYKRRWAEALVESVPLVVR